MKVGKKRQRYHLVLVLYGNRNLGKATVCDVWLSGSLRCATLTTSQHWLQFFIASTKKQILVNSCNTFYIYIIYKSQLLLNFKSISLYLWLKFIWINPTAEISLEIIFFHQKIILHYSQKVWDLRKFISNEFFFKDRHIFYLLNYFFNRTHNKKL